jgi:hypothetical protein
VLDPGQRANGRTDGVLRGQSVYATYSDPSRAIPSYGLSWHGIEWSGNWQLAGRVEEEKGTYSDGADFCSLGTMANGEAILIFYFYMEHIFIYNSNTATGSKSFITVISDLIREITN